MSFSQEEIKAAVISASPSKSETIAQIIDAFEHYHPQYSLNITFYSNARYKQDIESFIEQTDYDVVQLQAGKRLTQYIDSNKLTQLDPLIDTAQISHDYPQSTLHHMSNKQGHLFAVPLAIYSWGFYYNKAVFKKNNLEIPNTWSEFLSICQTLSSKNIIPIVQANKENWEALAWLDFLLLKQGGVELRNKFINQQPLSIHKSKQVINPLMQLVNKKYIYTPDEKWGWDQSISAVYRGVAAMTLTGMFTEGKLSESNDKNIGFFPFPESKGTIAPLDVLAIPNSSKNKKGASALLSFLSQREIHSKSSIGIGWLPALKSQNNLVLPQRQQSILAHLQNSTVLVPYLDKEISSSRAQNVNNALNNLLLHNAQPDLIDLLQNK